MQIGGDEATADILRLHSALNSTSELSTNIDILRLHSAADLQGSPTGSKLASSGRELKPDQGADIMRIHTSEEGRSTAPATHIATDTIQGAQM